MKTIFKAAAVGSVFLAGCVASDQVPRGNYSGIFNCDSSEAPAKAESAESGPAEARHVGPWSWEELAVRAGERSTAMKEGRLEALVKRLKAEQDVAWKDPEFRFGQRWSDDYGSSYRDKYDDSKAWRTLPDSREKHDDGDGWMRQGGIRFYIPNPFINHYVAARGEASVRASEAKAETEAYGIYTEVKMLCAEYFKASRDAELYAKRARLAENMKKVLEEERENSVSRSPFDIIHAETQYRRAELSSADLERSLSRLKRTIAKLAGVPAEGFEIAEGAVSLPDPATLSLDALAEVAFARRPDLARAIAERDAAEAGVGAAKAAYVPWFRFVEGSYRRAHDDDTSSARSTGSHEYSDSRSTSEDWSVELAITIPLFTWCGDSVKISRQIRDCAEERVASLYDDVREEVRVALNGYVHACSRDDVDSHERFVAEISREIEDYAKSDATLKSESERSRQALVDYQILYNEVHSEKIEAALRLESVLGGPIPTTAR